MNSFTYIFLTAVLLGAVLEYWLAARQSRHVQANADAVPDAFVGKISLAEHRKAANYTLARLQVGRFEIPVSAAVLLGWTLGGGIAVLDAAWQTSGLSALPQGVGLILSVLIISATLALPLSLWRTFGVESRFGFNRTTPQRYAKDLALQALIGLALGTPLLVAVLWVMDTAGANWWVFAWLLWMGFTLFVTWAYPTWIAPLFNSFDPLENPSLRSRLESLLSRCGFRSEGMYVMDGSRRSSHGNAYFTGFGRNKRIVFFDTLLNGLADQEVEAVLAHELGHFKKRHVVKRLLLTAVLTLFGLALLAWLATQDWFYTGLGVDRQSPALALLLFMLASPAFSFFASPLAAWLSRKHEFEADAFAAEHADASHLISGLVKMYRDNASTLTPDPLYSAFYHSHPPAPVRIAHLTGKAVTHPAIQE